MKTPKTKSIKPTQAALARTLGISRQLLRYHQKSPDAPPLSDVQGWRDFLADVSREAVLPPKLREQIAKARARLLEAQAAKAERDNLVDEGLMMPVADARRQNGEAWGFVFDELARLRNEVSPSLAGLSATDVYTRLHDFTEQMRRAAKEKFEKAA